MNNLILTGFGPYGNFSTNLSSEIVKKFSYHDENFVLVKTIIPVSWKRSFRTYEELLLKLPLNPFLVILLGIHSKNRFHLEKLAWNCQFGKDIDSKFKFGPIDTHILPWIKTRLDLNKIYLDIEEKTNISISNFPGYYLCNYLYYKALYLSKKEYPVIFIHVPNKGDIFEHIKKVKIISKAIIKNTI